MNWSGSQKSEGYEHHLLAIGLALIVLIYGGGKDMCISKRPSWSERWTPEFFKKPVNVPRGSAGKTDSYGNQTASLNESVEMVGLPGHYWVVGYVTFGDYAQFGKKAMALVPSTCMPTR